MKDYSKHITCLCQVLGKLKRETQYVCGAIHHTTSDLRVRDELRAWVIRLLDGAITLEDWLCRKHGIYVFDQPDYNKRMRELRIRWVEWMIKELERK